MDINLLPPKYKKGFSVNKGKWIKISVCLLVLSLITTTGVYYNSYKNTLSQTEKVLEKKLASLQPGLKSYTSHEETLAKNKKVEELTEQINSEKQEWSSLLKDVSASLVNGSWFTQLDKKDNKFIICGNADNFNAVSSYAIKLRKLKWFKNVDLLVAQKLTDASEGGSEVNRQKEVKNQDFFTFKSDQPFLVTDMIKFTIEAELKNSFSFLECPQGASK